MAARKPSPHKELTPADLRWKCNPRIFDFESTSELEPVEGIIGQERALRALRLGVSINSPGYNIYIAGLSGTGKATTVKKILETMARPAPVLHDYAYVNNFEDPDSPILLIFPAGQAKEFKRDVSNLVAFLRERIPQHFETETYLAKRKAILDQFSKIENELLTSFEQKLRKDNFSLAQVQVGNSTRPEILLVLDKQMVPVFQVEQMVADGKMSREQADGISDKYSEYQQEMVQIFKKGMKLNQELQQKVMELERAEVEVLIAGAMGAYREKYKEEKVLAYLRNVEDSILENLSIFKGQKPAGEESDGMIIDYFRDYEVNIILDNSNTRETPVIIDISPSFTNLFGTIEKTADGRGGWYADFTRIKAGTLLKANGGFIVLNVHHIFEEPGVWRNLKRVLTYRKLEIQDHPVMYGFQPAIIKPEPLDIDAKVIIVGNNSVYSLLSEYEDDFKKIFKVKADFDYEVTRTGGILVEYARVIKKTIAEEGLLEFDKTAIAYLLELASRYAGRKDKLTTRFSALADIAREADYWAKESGSPAVGHSHVIQAYAMRRERHSLMEEKLSSMIKEDTIMIETDTWRSGQINGLAVYGNDFFAFGKPSRITTSIAIGAGSIINVEREAGLSGKSYDKGVLIISGFFRETFGQNFPLSFAATLVFEQSYGMIDGDSASGAEVFILLSALSGLPIYQGIAVTGSVNQKGSIQPIGGVNEKIEGFFDLCAARGLNGSQGVIIPVQNVKDLMLRDDVVDAVAKKKFHVWPIATIQEGIYILTGKPAGELNKLGHYPKGTVYGLVEDRLKQLYDRAKHPFRSHAPAAPAEEIKAKPKRKQKK